MEPKQGCYRDETELWNYCLELSNFMPFVLAINVDEDCFVSFRL